MKEIHKILEQKIDLALKPLGYKKYGQLKWYICIEGFCRAIEIQRSQWSDEIYINLFIYLYDENRKPTKKDPYLRTQMGGCDVPIDDDIFNDARDLHEGNAFEKTNIIPEFLLKGLDNTLGKLTSIGDVIFWVKNHKFSRDSIEDRYVNASDNDPYTKLGITD